MHHFFVTCQPLSLPNPPEAKDEEESPKNLADKEKLSLDVGHHCCDCPRKTEQQRKSRIDSMQPRRPSSGNGTRSRALPVITSALRSSSLDQRSLVIDSGALHHSWVISFTSKWTLTGVFIDFPKSTNMKCRIYNDSSCLF